MKACLLLFLSLAIVSCAPPYSAVLNSSAGLAGQMTLLGTIGPVGSPNGDSTTAIKFLPTKPSTTTTTLSGLSPVSGFLVSESSGNESLTFAYQQGSSVQVLNSGIGFSLAGADPNYPLYEYDVIASTATQAGIIVYLLNGASVGNNTYQTFLANLPSGPFNSPPSTATNLTNVMGGGQPVLGAQVLPVSVGVDRFNFLFNTAGINQGGFGNFASPVFTSSGTTNDTGVPSLSGAGNRVLYYQNSAATLSYASYYSAGQWVCWNWTIPPATPKVTQLTSVTRRIDAVLTNGDLISTQDGTLTEYDLNGTELNSVSLGGLQFCYEAYVGTTPYVFFSLSLGFSHQAWAFRVYAIPTSAMRGLKG